MSKSRSILATLVIGTFLAVLVGSSAFAAEAKPATPFGTIDIERAFNDFDKKKQLEQELMDYLSQLQEEVELRATNKLLTPEEFAELANLTAKPRPEAAEKERIDKLLAISKEREQELRTLQQKPNATDAEKARLKELQDQMNKTDASMKEDEQKYNLELAKRQVDLSRQVMQEVEAAVAVVAKEKGLSIVFNKSAGDGGLIIYSSVDITDQVLAKLNKS